MAEIEIPQDIKDMGDEAVIAYTIQEQTRLAAESGTKPEPTGGEGGDPEKPEKPETPIDLNKGGNGESSKNEVEWSSILGENFKTEEEVRAANIPEKLKELASLTETNKGLKDKVKTIGEQLKNTENPFFSDDFFKINELAKKSNRGDYSTLSRIVLSDFDKMDDVDILLLKELYDNPERIGQEGRIKEKILNSYGLDKKLKFGEDIEEEEREGLQSEFDKEQGLKKMNLEDAAIKIKREFKELRDGVKMPETLTEEQIKEKQDKNEADIIEEKKVLKEGWGKVINEYSNHFKTISITGLVKEDGKDELQPTSILDFEISDEDKKSCLDAALNYFTEAGVPLEEKSLPLLRDMTTRMIKEKNELMINYKIGEKYRAMTSDEWAKISHNPSALQNTDGASDNNLDTPEKKNKSEQEKAIAAERGY